MASQAQFSVIIPTLQRSEELRPLLELCSAHPRVLEILLINNAPQPITWEIAKLRVLDQEENIFVNPAWNLGAREARGDYLAIINDDVLFDSALFDYAAKTLSRPAVGILGLDGAFINKPAAGKPRVRIATRSHVSYGYGMAMFLRRKHYVPIPDSIKIWGGDAWLFLHQKWPNRVISGIEVKADVSVTSSSEEFQKLRYEEYDATHALIGSMTLPWWLPLDNAILKARQARGQLRQKLGR